MDRAQLLTEIELALVLLDLDLRLSLDVFGDTGTAYFALDATEEKLQSLADVEALQDLVFVGDLEVEVGRREIREPAWIRDVHLENRWHFVRNTLDQLGECFGASHDARDQIIHFIGIGRDLFRRLDAHNRKWIGLHHAFDDDATETLQSDLNSLAGKVDPLVNASRHADSADKTLRVEYIVMIATGDDQPNDESRLLVRLEQSQVLRRAHLYRDSSKRVNDCRSQRHQGQRCGYVGLQDVVFALGGRHSIPL